MRDKILKWWFREWSNWEFDRSENIYGIESRDRIGRVSFYKRTSNDGVVEFMKVEN